MAVNQPILSAIATTGSRISDLPIKDGQLVFVHYLHRIVLDFDGKRTFYNQIVELQTENDRLGLLAPIVGIYYFVIETAVLWTYRSNWIQLTAPPQELINFTDILPEVGHENTLYINKEEQNISIWDEKSLKYITIAHFRTFFINNITKEIYHGTRSKVH